MAKIFLSYRRHDSAGVAGRIYDRLRAHFGDDAIFMDIDSIPFGEDFREHIDAAVGQCDVVLAVIGTKWAGEAGASRRLDDPRDFVRIELESALNRKLPVIPILIDHAGMPGEADLPSSLAQLAFRNAIEVDQGRDFHPHVDRLVRGIEFLFERANATSAHPSNQPQQAAPTGQVAKGPGHPQKVSPTTTGQPPNSAPKDKPRPQSRPSTSHPDTHSKATPQGTDGLRTEGGVLPTGVIESECSPIQIPAAPRQPVSRLLSQYVGAAPERNSIPRFVSYLAAVALVAGVGLIIQFVTTERGQESPPGQRDNPAKPSLTQQDRDKKHVDPSTSKAAESNSASSKTLVHSPTSSPPQGGLLAKPATAPITVALMPTWKGNRYSVECRKGAEEAARELGIELIWDGPDYPDPAKQNEVIDTWITRGVDVIAVAVENREGISSVLRKARERGIKVLTWDADADSSTRDFFVNQATPEGIGQTLMDNAARVLGGKGSFAIITASLTNASTIAWLQKIEARRQEKYPQIKMAALRPCDDLQKKAFDEASSVMNADPSVKLFMSICTPAVPGAAEAVKQSGRTDVKVIGLGLPNDNKRYVHEGVTDCVVLWNPIDLGYLTVTAAAALHDGTLKTGASSLTAGRLGKVEVKGDHILLGHPFLFNKGNIDHFDF
jgi:ABC-type sugar transport system substrate-binding protein